MPMDLELGAYAPLPVPLFRGLPELLIHASVHMYVCVLCPYLTTKVLLAAPGHVPGLVLAMFCCCDKMP